jgi:hypothetical protein
LFLGGLKTLSAEAAEALAKSEGEYLSFGSTRKMTLTAEAAEALAKWRGETLCLNGLAALPGVAEALAKWKGPKLRLEGLKTQLSRWSLQDCPALLHAASEHGGIGMAHYLVISIGSNPNDGDPDGWTPLLRAAKNHHWEIVKLLVDAKARLNDCVQNNGNTSLHFAAMAGNSGMVKWLLEKGADMQIKNSEGKMPLHCAADSGDIDTIRLLVYK